MLDERLASVRRWLVIQLDSEASPAIALFRQHNHHLSILHLHVQDGDGSDVSYIVQGAVPLTVHTHSHRHLIQWIRELDADGAILFTPEGRSPYVWAYRCYLAGIPIRIGLSKEFGGQVLSHEIIWPELDEGDRHIYLLQACGLIPPDIPVTPQAERSGQQSLLH